jgi:hypothetical protein
MAFINSATAYGRDYPQAYIRVAACLIDKQVTQISTEGWESQEQREAGLPALSGIGQAYMLATNMDLNANNPIEYAYKLLEASGRFPEAAWGIVANIVITAKEEVETESIV